MIPRFKNIVLIMISFVILTLPLFGIELESINLDFTGSQGFNSEQSLNSISGIGFAVTVEGKLTKNLYLNLTSSHLYLGIDQENALENWDWAYWEDIYGNTVDGLLQKDKYDVELEPVQKLSIKPYTIELKCVFNLSERLSFNSNLGFGVAWYKRELWLKENWQKYFATIDYTYQYNYRNNARPRRDGFAYLTRGKLGVNYRLSEYLKLFMEVGGYYYLKNINNPEYLPLDHSLDLSFGIKLLY